ncbi:phosphoribosylaminoimidazole synthetase [candidate division KD3-62 bacterium DG_56]|uniref:Phosphoribosylformylglycinamidine cyclo-ligase n=1 Tax=candidate division KD3-62 bacterium DG_56 TaxID=1704032 RepID=A0A0S7XPH6_9BACT|nr:MAG: phosphoribosylaminoimidazole synthetase [candidate division KD3-62 bacterium DG_56]
MPKPKPLTYRDAGVDIDAKAEALARLKPLIRSTFDRYVASDLGAFGSLYSVPEGYQSPVLVSSVDSVGTKVKIATMIGRHDTVGQDIVFHCGNDILVQGARPLFFMDYLAAHKLQGEFILSVAEGLVAGCRRLSCSLIGGETAEMPDIYAPGEYDLVGFILGLVERDETVTGDSIRPGDVLIGLGSDGLHTNGYTLARKVAFEIAGWPPDEYLEELGCTISAELMRIHRPYGPAVLPLLDEFAVHGMAHITGGGIPDNLLRPLPEGCRALVRRGTWPEPPIFGLLQRLGNLPADDMLRTFNMGIGFILVVPAEQADPVRARLEMAGEQVYGIGEIVAGERSVQII